MKKKKRSISVNGVLKFITDIELSYNFEFSDEDFNADKFKTVDDFIEYIELKQMDIH